MNRLHTSGRDGCFYAPLPRVCSLRMKTHRALELRQLGEICVRLGASLGDTTLIAIQGVKRIMVELGTRMRQFTTKLVNFLFCCQKAAVSDQDRNADQGGRVCLKTEVLHGANSTRGG